MSQQEIVLVDGPDLSTLRSAVREIPARDVSVLVDENDYINEPGLELESYGFFVDILGVKQADFAKRVADLARTHGWKFLWLTNGSHVVEAA